VWIAPESNEETSFNGKPLIEPLGTEGGPGVTTAEFSKDGSRVLTASSDAVARIWRIPVDPAVVRRANLVTTLIGHSVGLSAAVFSADDSRVATTGEDSLAKVWNPETGRALASFEHPRVVETAMFDPGLTRLITGSRDGAARIWELERGRDVAVGSPIHAVAVSRDGAVAVARDDSFATVVRGKQLTKLGDEASLGRMFAIAFSPDGTRLVTAGESPEALIWQGDQPVKRLLLPDNGHVRAIAFSATAIAAACDRGEVLRWAETGARLRTLVHPDKLPIVAVAMAGSFIVAVDDQGNVLAWDTNGVLLDGPRSRYVAAARAVAFSHDGTRLAVCSATEASVFAVVPGAVAEKPFVTLDGPMQDVRTVSFTIDDTRVITAGGDSLARVWDVAKGKLLGTRDAHGAAIESLAVSADDSTLWAGGSDGVLRAWDIHVESREVSRLHAQVHVPWHLGDDDVVTLTSERGD
jgi:WD40 repeat protein